MEKPSISSQIDPVNAMTASINGWRAPEEDEIDAMVDAANLREISELDPQTAIAKFEGSDQIAEAFSEEEIAEAERAISNARMLGMDAMAAFAPMHFRGDTTVTVDREGIHIVRPINQTEREQ